MNADRIEFYARKIRGIPISDLGRIVREILRDSCAEAVAAEREKHDAQIKSLGEAITRQHEAAEQLAARVMQAEWETVAAVAAEREACAKVCDALRDCEENTDGYRAGAGWCGEAIRSRGT